VSRPLPRAAGAVIAAEKLRDYILSPAHPIGRFKAAFFAQLGYAQADWQRLAADLRSQHLPLAAQEMDAPPFGRNLPSDGTSLRTEPRFGRKYRIRGPLTGPTGRTATLVSIWMVRTGEEAAHLVTVCPEGS
jgi:hypothetical protein